MCLCEACVHVHVRVCVIVAFWLKPGSSIRVYCVTHVLLTSAFWSFAMSIARYRDTCPKTFAMSTAHRDEIRSGQVSRYHAMDMAKDQKADVRRTWVTQYTLMLEPGLSQKATMTQTRTCTCTHASHRHICTQTRTRAQKQTRTRSQTQTQK
jgi:hypothetical protein